MGDFAGDAAADSAHDVAKEVGQGIAKEVAGDVQGRVLEQGAKALGLKNKGNGFMETGVTVSDARRLSFMETGVTASAAFTAVAPSTAVKMKKTAKAIRKQRKGVCRMHSFACGSVVIPVWTGGHDGHPILC